nr:immunoglobulin light chain junction region [Macaca mulatta]MOX85778.1 immunoglobulin light chain junction region [Macaca mulatta]MOX86111.1 immunoglobulin light chain junction region [Macaca mulatta]MOX87364.1 immunoglobulin light chain junction region [Macaca mulatta]MOX89109.1 immunoglobulin light chain junction region [Macaca mulatta]
CQQYSHWPTF